MLRKFLISLLAVLAFAPAAFGQITVDDSLADFYNQPTLATGGAADVVGDEQLKTCPLGSIGCWIFARSSAGKLNLTADQALTGLVLGLIDTLLQFAAIVAVVMLVVAGFRYIAARGESDGTDAAKKHIIWTLAGLIVIMLSLFIVKNVTDLVFRAATVSNGEAAKIESANKAADEAAQAAAAGGGPSESNSRAILQQQDADWGSGTNYEINIGEGAASAAKTGEVYGVHAGTQQSPSQPGAEPVPAGQSPIVRPESGSGSNANSGNGESGTGDGSNSAGGSQADSNASSGNGVSSSGNTPATGSNSAAGTNPAGSGLGTAASGLGNTPAAGSNSAAGTNSAGSGLVNSASAAGGGLLSGLTGAAGTNSVGSGTAGGQVGAAAGGALAGGPGSTGAVGSGSATNVAAGTGTGAAAGSNSAAGTNPAGSGLGAAVSGTANAANANGNNGSGSGSIVAAPVRSAPIAGLGDTSGDLASGWLINANQINAAGGSYGSAPRQEIISNANNWDSYGAAAARAAEANYPKLTAAQNGTSRNPGYSFVPPMTESAAVYSQRIGAQTAIEPFRDFEQLGRISADSPGGQGFVADPGSANGDSGNGNSPNSNPGAGNNSGASGGSSGLGSGGSGTGNGSNADSAGSGSNSQNSGQAGAGGLVPGSPKWQAYLLANSVSTGPGGAIAFDYGEAFRLGRAGFGSNSTDPNSAVAGAAGFGDSDIFGQLGLGADSASGESGTGNRSNSNSSNGGSGMGNGSGSDSNSSGMAGGSGSDSLGPKSGIESGWDSANLPPELSQQGPAALIGFAAAASLAAAWFARRRFSAV